MTESAQCVLCDRRTEAGSDFCNLHLAAHQNLEKGFVAWNRAFGGGLTEQEYYSKLEQLAETGPAVREVIKRLREKRTNELA